MFLELVKVTLNFFHTLFGDGEGDQRRYLIYLFALNNCLIMLLLEKYCIQFLADPLCAFPKKKLNKCIYFPWVLVQE